MFFITGWNLKIVMTVMQLQLAYALAQIFYHLFHNYKENMSHNMTKPTKWGCAQWRLKSAWASTQSDQSLRCLHEESLSPYLPIERKRRHCSDRADAQADLSLCWAHTQFVGFVTRRLILNVTSKSFDVWKAASGILQIKTGHHSSPHRRHVQFYAFLAIFRLRGVWYTFSF